MKLTRVKASVICLALVIVAAIGMFTPMANAEISDNTATWTGKSPKYVFMFIGDGLSYAQLNITSSYLGALEGKIESIDLPITRFPVVGTATTFDSSSFAPDSASTATSLSTGYKTLSGVVNMDETKKITYETITEKLAEQKDWKIGVVTTVNLNHATPAAYYGHQASRGNYYDLTQELANSDFDYFAGGKLLDSRTGSFNKLDVYDDFIANGYTLALTTEEFHALDGTEGKTIVISDDKEFSDDTGAMHYELDRPDSQPSLADYVETGIDNLINDNENGFFMMVEGGKVDWAAHANDAASVVNDVLAFSDAVQEAVDFYNEHPDETLILVTGDHETGGLSIGFAGTAYTTHLEMLTKQKLSFKEYDKQIVKFRESNASFRTVLESIKENFGLMASYDEEATEDSLFTLSDYEHDQIYAAYEMSMINPADRKYGTQELLLYETYEPLSVALTHILNQKAGIGWTSYAHTGVPVPVFAKGVGQELFGNYYDNTKVFYNLKALTGVN